MGLTDLLQSKQDSSACLLATRNLECLFFLFRLGIHLSQSWVGCFQGVDA